MANITTTKSANKPQVNENELKSELDRAKAAFAKEKTEKISIPEVLKSQIGATLFVGVNGVFLNIPVDGKSYEVPETFAKHIRDYLANLK